MFSLNKCNYSHKEFLLVNKNNIVSSRGQPGLRDRSRPRGRQNAGQFDFVSGQIVPGRCHQRAQHYLTQTCSCAFPAVRFTGMITPRCTIVRTLSSPKGTLYSPAFVSDILTRSHKTCHRREERRQMPESLNPLTKKSKRPLRLSWSHTIMSTPPRHTRTHTQGRSHMLIQSRVTHIHTLPERAAGVQSWQEPAENW